MPPQQGNGDLLRAKTVHIVVQLCSGENSLSFKFTTMLFLEDVFSRASFIL